MRGRDPGIPAEWPLVRPRTGRYAARSIMDCRVKAGNDGAGHDGHGCAPQPKGLAKALLNV